MTSNLYWATSREQFELLKPPAIPERILPSMRVVKCGEEAMMIQPRAPGILEASIVFLGPNLPPKYPPSRFPTMTPMRKLLAKTNLIIQKSRQMLRLITKPRQVIIGGFNVWNMRVRIVSPKIMLTSLDSAMTSSSSDSIDLI